MDQRNYDENKFISDYSIEALLIKLHYQHLEMKILTEDSRVTSIVLKEFYNKVHRALLEKEFTLTSRTQLKSSVTSNIFNSCLDYIDLVNEWDEKLYHVGIKVKTLQKEFYKLLDDRTEEVEKRINKSIAQLKSLRKMRNKSPNMPDICFVIWNSAVRFRKNQRSSFGQWTVPKALETLIGAHTDKDVPKPKRVEKKRLFKKKERFSS